MRINAIIEVKSLFSDLSFDKSYYWIKIFNSCFKISKTRIKSIAFLNTKNLNFFRSIYLTLSEYIIHF